MVSSKIAFLFALILVSCGTGGERPAFEPIDDDPLAVKTYAYRMMMASVTDAHGFIETAHCDALLFTALAYLGHDGVDLRAAREPNGRWHRRPAKDCYPVGSKSTISRDMLLGVMWYALAHGDLELVESMWEYGAARSWIMGDGLRSRTVLTPVFIATLGQLIYKLGGADHWERHIPLPPGTWAPGVDGFEAHLQVSHILLRSRIYGTIEDTANRRLVEHAARMPLNPLFQYGAGNMAEARRLLMDERFWPSDRLPASKDRCSPWILERDFGPSWLPCNEERQHSGGDFLFVAYLLQNR